MEHGNVQPKGFTQEKFLIVNTGGELQETLYGEIDIDNIKTDIVNVSGDAELLYVNKSGDTMTGDLVIDSQVAGNNLDALTINDTVGGKSTGITLQDNGNNVGFIYKDGINDLVLFRSYNSNIRVKTDYDVEINANTLDVNGEIEATGQIRGTNGLTISGAQAQFNNSVVAFSNLSGNNAQALRTAGQVTGGGGSGLGSSLSNQTSFQNMTGDYTRTPVALAGNHVRWGTTVNFVTTGITVSGVADFYAEPNLDTDAIGGGDLTITDYYGFYRESVGTPVAGVTIGTDYGIYLEDVNGGTTDNYAIYTNAGKIRFGDTVQSVGIPSSAQSIAGGYTVTSDDYGKVVYATGNGVITLPASPSTDAHLWIKNKNAFDVTIDGNGNNIEESATDVVPARSSLHLHFDGTEWWVI